MTKKEPSKAEATAIIYGKLIESFEAACFDQGIVSIWDAIPKDIDIGTLRLAIQHRTSELYVRQRFLAEQLYLSDYLNYCNELNNRYEDFGFYELTLT